MDKVGRRELKSEYVLTRKCNNLIKDAPIGEDGKLLWQTGNGADIQRVLLSYSPSLNSLVLTHQGTNRSSSSSIFHDLQLHRTDPDPTRLGFLGSGVGVHVGFQKAWLDTTDEVMQTLKQFMGGQSRYKGANLIVTGNSLGAAIALLQAARITHELGHEVMTILCESMHLDLAGHGNRN